MSTHADLRRLANMLALDADRPTDQAGMLEHLGATAELVESYGGSKEQINAAWLHEALSIDSPSQALLDEIEARYGEDVVEILKAFRDAPSYPETPRRIKHEEHICNLRRLGRESAALVVVGADAIHQARQILGALRASGGGRDTRAGRAAARSTGFFISVFSLMRDYGREDIARDLREIGEEIQSLLGMTDSRWMMANPEVLAERLEQELPDHISVNAWMGYLSIASERDHGFQCDVNTSNLICTTEIRVTMAPELSAEAAYREMSRRFLHRARQLTEGELDHWARRGFRPDTHGDLTRANRTTLSSANGLVFRRPMSARLEHEDELVDVCRWLDDTPTVHSLDSFDG